MCAMPFAKRMRCCEADRCTHRAKQGERYIGRKVTAGAGSSVSLGCGRLARSEDCAGKHTRSCEVQHYSAVLINFRQAQHVGYAQYGCAY